MATRGEDLNTRLTATDDASAVVDRLAAKVGDLEDRPHEVDMTADTADVQREIDTLDRRLAGLSDEEKAIVLRASATQAQREIDRLTRDLANARKFGDDEITMRVEARGNAQARLQAIQSELREIDGRVVTPEVRVRGLDETLSKLDEVGVSLGPAGALGRLSSGAGIFGALAAGAVLTAEGYANAAIAARDLSTLTGSEIEQASRLNAVWSATGAEIKDLQDVLLQMNGVLASTPELAAQLGIDTADGANLVDRFVQISDALDRIPDAAQRSNVASQLFGEEGVRQYNALRNSVDDLGTALDDVSGKQVFDAQAAEDAQGYRTAINELRTELVGLSNDIGSDVVPDIVTLLGLLREVREGDWIPGPELPGWLGTADQKVREVVLGLGPLRSALGMQRERDEAEENLERIADSITSRVGGAWREVADAAREALADPAGTSQSTTAMDAIAESIDTAASNFRRFGADGVENMGAVEAAADQATGAVDNLASGIGGLLDLMSSPLDEQVALLDIAEQLQTTAEARAEAGVRGSAAEIRALQSLSRQVERFVRETPGLNPSDALAVFTAINSGDLAAIRTALDDLTADRRIRISFDVDTPTVFDTSRGPITIAAPGTVTGNPAGTAPAGVDPNTLARVLEGLVGGVTGGGTTVNNYFGQPTTEQVAAAEREFAFRNGPRISVS